MSNVTTIAGLPSGTTPLSGTEAVPVWQAGTTVQVPASAFTGNSQIFQAININPGNSAAVNQANLQAWVTLATAAGGGIIQLGSFSTPIPINNSSGPAITLGTSVAVGNSGADTPFNNVRIVGSGWQITQTNQRATSGTVLQGTSSSNPIIAYNAIDNTVDYASQNNLTASYLQCAISDIAFDTCSYGIKIGALSKSGLCFGKVQNIYVSNYSQWGVWLENFQYIDVQEINAAAEIAGALGQIFIGASFGTLINPGNASFRRLFGQQYNSGPMAGIRVRQRTSAGGNTGALNDVNFYDIQSNVINATTTQAYTWSSGTTISLAANIQNFPVDMPFTVTSTAGGFTQYQTYYVKTNSGGTGSGTITASNLKGGAAITPNAGGTIVTYGFEAVEICGYGVSGGNEIQTSKFDGVDTEANYTTGITIQNCNVELQINNIAVSPQGSTCANSITGRSAVGHVYSSQSMILDYDIGTVIQLATFSQLATDTAVRAVVQGVTPPGMLYDRNQSSFGLNLGGTPSNLIGCQMVYSNGLGGQAFWNPQVGIGQRAILAFNGNNSLAGYYCGAVVFNSSSNQTQTLVSISVTTATTTGTNGSPSAAQAGAPFLLFNEGTGIQTIAITGSNYFNQNSNLTSIIMPPKSFVALRAAVDGTNGFWVVESMIGCNFNADPTVSLQAPTTGFSITPAAGVLTLELNPAGTLATGTVTMPATPGDNQQLVVMSTQIVTALTVSANAGQTINNAPTAIAANTSFGYRYNASLSKWLRLY